MEITANFIPDSEIPTNPAVGDKWPVQGDTYSEHWEWNGFAWDFVPPPPVAKPYGLKGVKEITAHYTLQAIDEGYWIDVNSTSMVNITISITSLPLLGRVYICKAGSGNIQLVADSVSIRGGNYIFSINGVITLQKIYPDVYATIGGEHLV